MQRFYQCEPAGPDLTGRLGYEVRLNGSYNPTNATNVTAWVPPDGIVCPTCLSTDAIPPGSTQYKLVVTTADGCVAADSMFVDVTLDRAIYIPNTFTPDRDTRNKIFKLFGNRATKAITSISMMIRLVGMALLTDRLCPQEYMHIQHQYYLWIKSPEL